MTPAQISAFKNQLETGLRETLNNTLKTAKEKEIPQIMIGAFLMQAAGNFCQRIKNNYGKIAADMKSRSPDFTITEQEWDKIVDDATTKVLGEFIELPDNNDIEETD